MQFFVPHARNAQDAQQVYDATKAFAKQTIGATASSRKIQRIDYIHKGMRYTAEVGQVEPRTGEEVLVILETDPSAGRPYLVCTANHGVVRGDPVMVGNTEAQSITDFAP